MGVYLKDDDYIEFVLSFGLKPELQKSLYFKLGIYALTYYDKYYDLFLLVHQKINTFKPEKFHSIRVSRQGLDAELKITKTSVKLLSKPHMQECREKGKK